MIGTRFERTLKDHGYKCVNYTKYKGENVYEKEHLYNKIVCTVNKDSHGKAQEMTFIIHTGRKTPQDFYEFKSAELDRGYLYEEAKKIFKMFEALREIKGSVKRVEF